MKTNYYNANTETWCAAEVVADHGRTRDLEIPGFRAPTSLKGVLSTSRVEPSRSGWCDGTIPGATTQVPSPEPPPAEDDDQEDAKEDEGVAFVDLNVTDAKEQVDAETDVEVLEAWHAEEIDGKERVTLLSHIEERIEELAE